MAVAQGRRREAADAVVRAIRTGEQAAADIAKAHFAPAVVLDANGAEIAEHDRVVDRISGQWAQTPVYGRGEWSLPEDVDTARVEASYRNGVLKIVIPKREASKPRRIQIQD